MSSWAPSATSCANLRPAMWNDIVVIDADGHILDRDPMYRERLPARFRNRESLVGQGDGFDRTQNGAIVRRGSTVQVNLEDNDVQGIDVQVLYPTGALTY